MNPALRTARVSACLGWFCAGLANVAGHGPGVLIALSMSLSMFWLVVLAISWAADPR